MGEPVATAATFFVALVALRVALTWYEQGCMAAALALRRPNVIDQGLRYFAPRPTAPASAINHAPLSQSRCPNCRINSYQFPCGTTASPAIPNLRDRGAYKHSSLQIAWLKRDGKSENSRCTLAPCHSNTAPGQNYTNESSASAPSSSDSKSSSAAVLPPLNASPSPTNCRPISEALTRLPNWLSCAHTSMMPFT